MSYSATSPLTGQGQASAATIDAFVRQMGQQLAATYAPDHAYKEPPAVGASIIAYGNQWGINSDLAAAQFIHESAGGQSAIFRAKLNPAGLGAVNSDPMGGALSFPTADAGIRAQIAHLADYARGQGDWTQYDPRAGAMGTLMGVAHVLSDLDGRWAVPGVGYGAAIAALANQLVTFSGTADTIGGAMGRDPQAEWLPSSNFDAGRTWQGVSYQVEFITCHMTDGSYDGALSWLRGKAAGSSNADSSAHYLIRRDGHIAQLVDENDTAWADGNYPYNLKTIAIEHENFTGQPFTDAQIQASIQLQARIARRRGWTKIAHNLGGHDIGHSEVPDPNNPSLGGGIDHHTGCPGPLFPWDAVIAGVDALLAGQQAPVLPAQPAGSITRYFPETQHRLANGFRAFWESYGDKALPTFGFPISEEFQMAAPGADYSAFGLPKDTLVVQYFERARFEWHPATGAPFDVQLGLLGSERHPNDVQSQHPDAFKPVQP